MARTTTDDTPRREPKERALVWAAVVFVVGLLGTVALTVQVAASSRTEARDEFVGSAEQATAGVEAQVRGYFDELRDIGAFVSERPDATAEQFAGFVEATGIFEQFPSLVGVFYIHRVPEADLNEFVELRQGPQPGFAPFVIGPTPPGATRYLLTYYEAGTLDLELPIGTDLSPIVAITALIDEAEPSGTGVVGSFQEDPALLEIAENTDFGLIDQMLELDFFLGVPSYDVDAEGGRGPDPAGWVGATVQEFGDVVEAAASGAPDDVGLSLTVDLSSTSLGERDDLARVAELQGAAGTRDDAAYEVQRDFEVEGVAFSAVVWSAPDADEMPIVVPLLLVGGVVASVLASSVVYLRSRARERDRLLTAELADKEQFQRDIVDSFTGAMVVLDSAGAIVAANPAWTVLRGLPLDAELDADLGLGYVDAIGPSLRAGAGELAVALGGVLDGSAPSADVDVPIEVGSNRRWYAVRGTPLRGRKGGAVVVHTDVTERKRSLDELEFKASRDDLTGLLNRAALEGEVEQALRRARAWGTMVALLFIDLDGFKPVNDQYGHAVGDDVLRGVAQRLSSAVRTTDRVARIGGDEFVVLIGGLGEPAVAESSAERLLDALRTPIRVDDLDIAVAASIGVAIVDSPLDADSSSLIDLADRAMYEAKQSGGARYFMR